MTKLNISVGKSRWDEHWKNKTISWERFAKDLEETVRTHETVKEYRAMTKDEQGKIKDVGGFVGGHLAEGRRLKGNVQNRSLVTLDIDYGTLDFWDDFTLLFDYAAVLYSTHKHTPKTPRYRLIIPLSTPVSPEQYEAIARKIADDIDIELFDDTTYQPSRLMYWPSTSKDGEYVYHRQDGKILDPKEILDTYDDWSDCSYWPESTRVRAHRKSTKDKQEDPCTKKGVIGAFCRAYTIQDAIDRFLSDVYAPCNINGRYTYLEGSTSAGLVIYDDVFAYSNHSTDPAGGQLCNAFDLVRIHKFGILDETANKNAHVNSLPSYKEMIKLASDDPAVKKEIVAERISTSDFTEEELKEYDDSWISQLEVDKGQIISSIDNVVLILENDPRLKGAFANNEFYKVAVATRDLPWRKVTAASDQWLKDSDYANLELFLEQTYKISGEKKIMKGFEVVAERHAFHPVRDYLAECEWDGIPRVETLLVDYLGAEDTPYTRAVTRKTLVAAIARVMHPGCKFDYMLTLTGAQGLGKSTLWDRLGVNWFSDSLTCVSGKEAYEQLDGVWIMEMAELSAMRKSEVEAAKQFITKREDRYRKAYARAVETYRRQNIFVGTTNDTQFLRDDTGGRRFWIVDLPGRPKKSAYHIDNDTVRAIWGEAKKFYDAGEELVLPPTLEAIAKSKQESHSEENPKLGLIMGYVDTLLPKDWNSMDLYQRRSFLNDDSFSEEKGSIRRDKVCAAEIWCEVYGKKIGDITKFETREINYLLDRLPGWTKVEKTMRFGRLYGVQRGYKREE